MNALATDLWSRGNRSDNAFQLRTQITHSGFSVAMVPRSKYDPTTLAEVFFKLVGVLLIPASGIVLFLPDVIQGPAQAVADLGILAAFVLIGVSLFQRANRGFRRKIYVDSVRDEVRTGTMNLAGDFHVLAAYRMSDIESFFIYRSKNAAVPAKLKMRLKAGAKTVGLLEGPEESCVKILERISHVLNPPKANNRRFVTKRTGAFIRMTFG